MNKYILGGVVLLIIAVTLFFIKGTDLPRDHRALEGTPSTLPENTQSKETSTIATNEKTVVYANDGFAPAEITVKAGETVTFVNQSDAPMWVASAPHPAHTLYPEFDQKASVSKGGTYSFTFEKLGAHPYHNHLLLGKYGKVIVK